MSYKSQVLDRLQFAKESIEHANQQLAAGNLDPQMRGYYKDIIKDYQHVVETLEAIIEEEE